MRANASRDVTIRAACDTENVHEAAPLATTTRKGRLRHGVDTRSREGSRRLLGVLL